MTNEQKLIKTQKELISWFGNYGEYVPNIIDLKSEIALLEAEIEQEYTTCDGCQMFQDCGCMLDDSCPPCSEHSQWTPKEDELSIQDFKDKYGLVYDDIETAIRNYMNGRIEQKPKSTIEQPDYYDQKIKEQEPEGVTAEEILQKWLTIPIQEAIDNNKSMLIENVIKVMIEYAKSKEIYLREELIKYELWASEIQETTADPRIAEFSVDEYLKQREKK